MSLDQFIRLLQSVITMTDKSSRLSVSNGKAILDNLLGLAWDSQKCDPVTLRTMTQAACIFESLIQCKEDFAGIPGDYAGNEAKRNRLKQRVCSNC